MTKALLSPSPRVGRPRHKALQHKVPKSSISGTHRKLSLAWGAERPSQREVLLRRAVIGDNQVNVGWENILIGTEGSRAKP